MQNVFVRYLGYEATRLTQLHHRPECMVLSSEANEQYNINPAQVPHLLQSNYTHLGGATGESITISYIHLSCHPIIRLLGKHVRWTVTARYVKRLCVRPEEQKTCETLWFMCCQV